MEPIFVYYLLVSRQSFTLLKVFSDLCLNSHILWVESFFLDRSQQVRVNGGLSKLSILNTAAPHGSVLSPLLFSMYTNGCVALKQVCNFIKYVDNTAIVGCLSDQSSFVSHLDEIDAFIKWCGGLLSHSKCVQN